ncbi:MAG: ROK family protein [Planctomycetia bacterium]|nr:ROK family protein [Planctomycetia bacterium]
MFLGIEIGGTKLQLGVGNGAGPPLVELVRRDVDPAGGAQGILTQLRDAAATLIAQHDVRRIGVGFGGPVQPRTGRVVKSHQIDGWNDFPLADWCRRELKVEAVLGNDADLAGLAEANYGAARDRDPVFYVTVGTGIGGGLIVGRHVYRGSGHGAAEIGHLRPGPQDVGAGQTVESIASGPGIVATLRGRWQQAQPRDAKDLLDRSGGIVDRLSAKNVAQAAAAGNQAARDAFGEATRVLGWAIAQVITLTAPEVVVVGGGVSLAGEELFYEPLRAEVERYVFPPFRGTYEILPPQLGEEMVVHGAVALAAERRA